ncbi:MAG: hypothetical protein ACOY3Y_06560 [Acidobacteriota bacterium]
MATRFAPEITIEDLVRLEPRAAAVLRRFGIICLQCGEPAWGTLRDLAADKGITDLGPLLEALETLNSPARSEPVDGPGSPGA